MYGMELSLAFDCYSIKTEEKPIITYRLSEKRMEMKKTFTTWSKGLFGSLFRI